jgi:hypothetical protein
MSENIFKNNFNNDEFHFKFSSICRITHITNFGHYAKDCEIEFAIELMKELIKNNWYFEEYENCKFTQ